MNQGPNKIFDEFAKLMTDAAGVAQGARKELESAVKSQGERWISQMDLVQRDEFESYVDAIYKLKLRVDRVSAQMAHREAEMGNID